MEAEITGISPSSSDSSACGSVNIKGKDPLPADLVIMGTGVGPATGFLKESGFKLEEDGGIKVDEHLRVPGHKNVYAVGDIAHYKQHPDGNERRVEHWNVAGQQVCLFDTDDWRCAEREPSHLSSKCWRAEWAER